MAGKGAISDAQNIEQAVISEEAKGAIVSSMEEQYVETPYLKRASKI